MQPNFIIFLTDDQGYGDLSCMGATDFKTPHLDRMAKLKVSNLLIGIPIPLSVRLPALHC